MPIIWRYLLKNYFKIFLLCLSSFISILLVIRFREIAKFAVLSSNYSDILIFILYQIPYILPIAMAVSSLIASAILLQTLSQNHELTALRSSGINLFKISFPIIFVSLVLSTINFTLVSEIASQSRVLSKKLILTTASKNPLFLLQKKPIMRMKGCYASAENVVSGKSTENVLIVANFGNQNRLSLLTAKKLSIGKDLLVADNVSMVTNAESDNFDHLVIENQEHLTMENAFFAHMIKPSDNLTDYEFLPLNFLLKKMKEQDHLNSSGILEIVRRISIGLSVFSFTLIGIFLSAKIGRGSNKKRLFFATILSCISLICLMSAKVLSAYITLSFVLYIIPHILIALICIIFAKKISMGVE